MKVAITSKGDTLNAKIDPRFGRCDFFAVYETENKAIEFFVNPNKDADGGAGPASAQFVALKGIEKVFSGNFGGKVKDVFKQLNIEMISLDIDSQLTIEDVVNSIKQ